jgi:hypothetical protein
MDDAPNGGPLILNRSFVIFQRRPELVDLVDHATFVFETGSEQIGDVPRFVHGGHRPCASTVLDRGRWSSPAHVEDGQRCGNLAAPSWNADRLRRDAGITNYHYDGWPAVRLGRTLSLCIREGTEG